MYNRIKDGVENQSGAVDGYILLTSAIIDAYKDDYSQLFPRCARTQYEFDNIDNREFRRRRDSIIYNLTHSVIRHVIDEDLLRDAFNQQLLETMKLEEITYKINL